MTIKSSLSTPFTLGGPDLTIERIYPEHFNEQNPDDRETLRIHLERYRFAAAQLSGQHILDMACGCGYGTALLAQSNPDKQVTGVDIDPAAIAYAQEHYRLPNISYQCADAETFRAGHKFNTIISLETIEHLPRPWNLIANCAELLAANGQLIASVPITPTLDGNPYHLHDFTQRSFFALFRAHGFLPDARFEQIQSWQFNRVFSKSTTKQCRSEGIGNTIAQYYLRHPLYPLARLYSILRYGFSNRYLTCSFKAVS